MFDLKFASIGVRKVCAQNGVRTAKWQPVHGGYDAVEDPEGDSDIVAQVHPSGNREVFPVTKGEIEEAGKYTWEEI